MNGIIKHVLLIRQTV